MNHKNIVSVLIVGAGFSGIALGVMLKRLHIEEFVIIDREHDFGGTWYSNTYPGAECDIQSHLYSFSFRPNPFWEKTYATQPQIHDYLKLVANEEQLYEKASFGHDVLDARWNEETGTWMVTTSKSEFEAKMVVFATGHLSDPKVPALDGLKNFTGKAFHSATWDHDYDLSGQRVAVVGTGASAIQIVPAISDLAQELTVFQRSAPYVIPRQDTVYSDEQRQTFHKSPETARDFREFLFWSNETRFLQRMMVPAYLQEVDLIAAEHRRSQIQDVELLKKVTPDYTIGCKRILLSNDWYPTLGRRDVELVAHSVIGFTDNAVVDARGEEYDVDCVIFCSGFEAAELPIARKIHGRENTRLDHIWTHGSEAFGGMAVSGFPNMFLMNGPHVGLGAGSIIFMIETQAKYISGAIHTVLNQDLESLDVKVTKQDDFIRRLGDRAGNTVWTQGDCQSWYLDPRSGRLTTIWPDQMNRFHAQFSTFDADDYDQVTARELQQQ